MSTFAFCIVRPPVLGATSGNTDSIVSGAAYSMMTSQSTNCKPIIISNNSGYLFGQDDEELEKLVAAPVCRDVKPQLKGQTSHAEFLEFNVWLDECLEDFGLDSSIYSRCIHSILRQPPEQDDVPVELSVMEYCTGLANTPVKKRERASLDSEQGSLSEWPLWKECARAGLLECLKTDDIDVKILELFVEEILNRYRTVRRCAAEDRRNDTSIDSGVCPTPEESFQNYDEAFPPLGESFSDELSILTANAFAAVNAGIITDDFIPLYQTSLNPTAEEDNCTKTCKSWSGSSPTKNVPASSMLSLSSTYVPPSAYRSRSDTSESSETSIGSVIPATANKRQKREDGNGNASSHNTFAFRNPPHHRKLPHQNRPLNSCPVFYSTYRPYYTRYNNNNNCYAAWSLDAAKPYSVLGQSPYFVVPKCRKVSPFTLPTHAQQQKVSQSSPPKACIRGRNWSAVDSHAAASSACFNHLSLHANDVPSWQCSEWCCPIHRGAELNFWNLKIRGVNGADEKLSSSSIKRPFDQDSEELTSSDGDSEEQCSLNGESVCSEALSHASSYESATAGGGSSILFDAPAFILHIINEDKSDPDISLGSGASADVSCELPTDLGCCDGTFREATMEHSYAAADYSRQHPATSLPQSAPEFTFSLLQTSHGTPYDNIVSDNAVEFCLPKFGTTGAGWGNAAHDGSANNNSRAFALNDQDLSATTTQVRSPTKLSNSYRESLPAFYQPYQLSLYKALDNEVSSLLSEGGITASGSSQQLSAAASVHKHSVPVGPQTHFIPIRSESMEDAYYPKPAFDELAEFVDAEGYHVLRGTRRANWRSLPLRFKPVQNNKATQTSFADLELLQSNSSRETEVSSPEELLMFPLEADVAPATSVVGAPVGASLAGCELWRENEAVSCFDDSCIAYACEENDTIFDDSTCSGPCCSSVGFIDEMQYPDNKENADIIQNKAHYTGDVQQSLRDCINMSKQACAWRRQDEHEEDQLLRYVSNISLISPLEAPIAKFAKI